MEKHLKSNHHSSSFSYLASAAEENFVLQLTKNVHHQSPQAMTKKLNCSKSLTRTTKEEEISVFDAERYYNMKLEDEKQEEDLVKNGRKVWKRKDQIIRSRPGTPSVFSESSWNSQTALLPSLMRNASQKTQSKVKGRNLLASLRCSGSCTDEKSIYVPKNSEQRGSVMVDGKKMPQTGTPMAKTRRNSHGLIKEEHYFAAKLHQRDAKLAEEDQDPRKSLDVFGSQKKSEQEDTVSMNLERKLSVLTWDAIPKVPSVQNEVKNGGENEDGNSDCSSDLFEIENLSGSGQPLFTSQTSDGLPSETETSTEFTTVSELEEKKTVEKGPKPPLLTEKEEQMSQQSGMTSCKSQKAARVSEAAIKTNGAMLPLPNNLLV